MEEFFKQNFSSLDAGLLFSLGLLTATCWTAVMSILCNMELHGHNPFYHYDTDSLMPIVAAIQGGAYGMWIGPKPGFLDNLTSSAFYAAATVLSYMMTKKAMDLWGPTQTTGKP